MVNTNKNKKSRELKMNKKSAIKDIKKINDTILNGGDLCSLLFDDKKEVVVTDEDVKNAQKLIDLFGGKI